MNRNQNTFRRTLPALGLLVLATALLAAVSLQETTNASANALTGPTPTPSSTQTPTPTATPSPAIATVRLSSSTYEVHEGYTARVVVLGTPTHTWSSGFVRTSDGTAVGGTACTAGVDYITVNNQEAYFSGVTQSQDILVITCPDTVPEADETVKITLSAGGNSVVVPPSEATLTIHAISGTPTPSSTPTPSPTPACSQLYTFSNNTPIAIKDRQQQGFFPPALASRSEIAVSIPLILNSVSVRLYGYNHTSPDDVDVMLVGPGGENAVIMSDVGGSTPFAAVNLTLADEALEPLQDDGVLSGGLFQPTNIGNGDEFLYSAPVPLGGSALSVFDGTMADGTWSLWVVDDFENGNVGSFAGGWEITFQVCPAGSPTPTPTTTPTVTPTPTPSFCSPTGSLDTTFDGDGKLTTQVLGNFDQANSVAIQADGKIVAAGESRDGPSYFSLARYNTNGSLDVSFAGDGTVATSFGSEFGERANSVAIQADGKIVAAGSISDPVPTGHDFALVRYNPNGIRDTTFDGDGKVTTHISGTTDIAHAVAIQPDGRIIAAGYSEIGLSLDFALVRYLPDGSLDTTFDGDGKVTTNISAGDQVHSVAVQPDGRIVVAGYSDTGPNNDFALVRYNTDGSLDPTFDGDGKVTTPILNADDEAYSLAIQADGRIIVAGSAYNGSNRDFAVVRYNTDGSLDTTFDGDGKVTTPVLASWDDGSSVAVQPDGRIILAGASYNGSNYDFAVVRYNADGSLDTTFDGDGKLTTPVVTNGSDQALSMAIQADGKIVAVGSSSGGSGQNSDFAVVRYGEPCSASPALFDYDADGKTDFSLFRPPSGAWYLQRSTAGFQGLQFGADGDKLTPADYDGDGKTDVSVYRPSSGTWYILNSATNTVTYPVFGVAEDLPAPGDYDGDGKADLTVFRPSQGTWYRQNSSDGSFFGMQFGATGDVPTVGDFDGDGKNDLGIFRPSVGDWYNIRSSNGSVFGERFGQTGDKIAPADYDGDGKTDIAIYRPSTGLWVVRNSATATYSYHVFGSPDDVPISGDYDGDGKADIGVWRPSDGTWYIKRSDNGQFIVFPWGQNGDVPTPAAFGN